MVYDVFDDYNPKENKKNINECTFAMELINSQEEGYFEKRVFEYIKLYLFKLASTTHSSACHILFENFSENSICKLKRIIEENGITFIPIINDYTISHIKNPDDLYYVATLVWNKKALENKLEFPISIEKIKVILTNDKKIDISIEMINVDERFSWFYSPNHNFHYIH